MTPAVRNASVARHVTDCATRFFLYQNFQISTPGHNVPYVYVCVCGGGGVKWVEEDTDHMSKWVRGEGTHM